jgi:DNA-binding transcriptional regulator YiaG
VIIFQDVAGRCSERGIFFIIPAGKRPVSLTTANTGGLLMKIHLMARTAPQIRAEIRTSPLSQREKAWRYNVSRATIRKWEKRDDVQDRSHRPHRMATCLTEAQEMILLEIPNMFLLPLDVLLVIAHSSMAEMTRSSLHRLLKRHNIPSLRGEC